MKEIDVLIIGGGPAGLTAAIYASRAGKRVIVIEHNICGGQIIGTGKPVKNLPGVIEVSGVDLAMTLTEQAEKSGAEIVYEEIKNIDLQNKVVNEYQAKSIIISTGASPRKLDAEGAEKEDGKRIHYCGLCDGSFYKGKDIVVVGGGNVAVEDSIYLQSIVKSVTIVNNTQKFNADATTVAKLNVKDIYHNSEILRVNKDSVEITGGKIIKCDGIFVFIGQKPNTEIFDVEKNSGGYIKTDNKMQTSIDGVFAAGDCREKDVRQLVTACGDGAVSAVSAVHMIGNGA